MRLEIYSSKHKDLWNEFVRSSRNATFMHEREYMEYHASRFTDFSLIVLDSSNTAIALLPANIDGTQVVSHAGLTFGGILVKENVSLDKMLQVFECILEHMKREGIKNFRYKTIPFIYHRAPCQEDLYCLFKVGAKLYRRDVLAVIEQTASVEFESRRKRGVKRAEEEKLQIGSSLNFAAYWKVLSDNLLERYGVSPVHSCQEIECLAQQFPENIKLHVINSGNQIIAGALLYISNKVCHVQYIASNTEARERGALDLLFTNLINDFKYLQYFDFGSVTTNDGRELNSGLMQYKESFGARTIVHDFYELIL